VDKSLLVKIIGYPATLIHHDTTIIDRWLWIKNRLPKTNNKEALLDIGCGTGAFTIGASLRGYQALGLSWDERNQKVAGERAKICNASTATFEVQDVRHLHDRKDLFEKFEVAICCENIEHILDDKKLLKDIASCLKPGGYLLLTAPYYHQRAISSSDDGPFRNIEDGGHVRRGYTMTMLVELSEFAGLKIEEISFCNGYLSQKIAKLYRELSKIHSLLAWLVILPLRILPLIFDKAISKFFSSNDLTICMEAHKPRFKK